MDENKMDLFDGFELTDDMLESVAGGYELPEYHKNMLRYCVSKMKAENMTLEQFIVYLRDDSPFGAYPDVLEAAITFAREVW